jgi:hypothetical protein
MPRQHRLRTRADARTVSSTAQCECPLGQWVAVVEGLIEAVQRWRLIGSRGFGRISRNAPASSPVSMTGSAALAYLSDAPWLSRHTFRKSRRIRRNRFCSQTNGPKVAGSPGGDRDDLVDTPSLRSGRLVCHGGFLRRQRLGRSFRAGLYDGKSEHRREHHAVCRARRSGQQVRPGRATLWPGRSHGAVRRSIRAADAFQSFPRLRLQRHAS